MIHYQNTLFPDNKVAFDADTFVNEQINDSLKDWISTSVTSGFTNLKSICEIQPLTHRAKSDVLHDCVFAQIKLGAHSLPENMRPTFYCDFSGNKKQHFEYNGYLYILRKAGSGTNGTKVDAAILNQELPMHVITIEYSVSPLWDAINSVSFKYIKGDGVELEYIIPTIHQNPDTISNNIPISTEDATSTYTPRFKQDKQIKAI